MAATKKFQREKSVIDFAFAGDSKFILMRLCEDQASFNHEYLTLLAFEIGWDHCSISEQAKAFAQFAVVWFVRSVNKRDTFSREIPKWLCHLRMSDALRLSQPSFFEKLFINLAALCHLQSMFFPLVISRHANTKKQKTHKSKLTKAPELKKIQHKTQANQNQKDTGWWWLAIRPWNAAMEKYKNRHVQMVHRG